MSKFYYLALLGFSLMMFNGCARDATAEDTPTITPTETHSEAKTNSTSSDTIWIAIVMNWNPVIYTIDKEFASELECWNYYDTGTGEGDMRTRYGPQVLDHQGNKPDKDYMKKHRPPHREYPTRMYKNFDGKPLVWLTCDIKGRTENI